MHGLFTFFSLWQCLINLTISNPAGHAPVANPWLPFGFPLPIQPTTTTTKPESEDNYDSRQLFEINHLPNGWLEVPIMTVADQDSAVQPIPGLFVSPSLRGYLRYNLVSFGTDDFFIKCRFRKQRISLSNGPKPSITLQI
jgi:hypothetical protein